MAGLETKHVLVVDDSLTDAELTMHALKVNGRTPLVTWLSTAHEALVYIVNAGRKRGARRVRPDLILLEVDVTGMGGLQLLERLKSDPRTKDIPIVMLSTRAEQQIVRRCLELGANDYVAKPDVAIEYFQKVGALADHWLMRNEQTGPVPFNRPETRHPTAVDSFACDTSPRDGRGK